MADQLRQIVAFCSKRYNENRATRPGLANAHLAIINRANDLGLSSADPEHDLLDFLSKPHSDPNLVKAAMKGLSTLGRPKLPM